MKPMKVFYGDGMVTIESEDINYSNIPGAYMIEGEKRDGEGIQINKNIDKDAAFHMCRKIASAIREFNYLNSIRKGDQNEHT